MDGSLKLAELIVPDVRCAKRVAETDSKVTRIEPESRIQNLQTDSARAAAVSIYIDSLTRSTYTRILTPNRAHRCVILGKDK